MSAFPYVESHVILTTDEVVGFIEQENVEAVIKACEKADEDEKEALNPVLSLESPTLDQLREALVKVSAENEDGQMIENIWDPIMNELGIYWDSVRVFDSGYSNAEPSGCVVFLFEEEAFYTKTPTELGARYEKNKGYPVEVQAYCSHG